MTTTKHGIEMRLQRRHEAIEHNLQALVEDAAAIATEHIERLDALMTENAALKAKLEGLTRLSAMPVNGLDAVAGSTPAAPMSKDPLDWQWTVWTPQGYVSQGYGPPTERMSEAHRWSSLSDALQYVAMIGDTDARVVSFAKVKPPRFTDTDARALHTVEVPR